MPLHPFRIRDSLYRYIPYSVPYSIIYSIIRIQFKRSRIKKGCESAWVAAVSTGDRLKLVGRSWCCLMLGSTARLRRQRGARAVAKTLKAKRSGRSEEQS